MNTIDKVHKMFYKAAAARNFNMKVMQKRAAIANTRRPSDDYMAGFCKTATDAGVDPVELIKVAFSFNDFRNGFKSLGNIAKGGLGLWGGMGGAIAGAMTGANNGQGFVGRLRGAWNGAKAGAKGGYEGATGAVDNMARSAGNAVGNAVNGMSNMASQAAKYMNPMTGLSAMWKGVKGMFGGGAPKPGQAVGAAGTAPGVPTTPTPAPTAPVTNVAANAPVASPSPAPAPAPAAPTPPPAPAPAA